MIPLLVPEQRSSSYPQESASLKYGELLLVIDSEGLEPGAFQYLNYDSCWCILCPRQFADIYGPSWKFNDVGFPEVKLHHPVFIYSHF